MGAAAGQQRGYSGVGGDTIVRCSQGHLFTTTWIVGSSVKAVRLGYKRHQRCPVCKKWRIVVPVRDDELTDEAISCSSHPGPDQAACDWLIQVSYISA